MELTLIDVRKSFNIFEAALNVVAPVEIEGTRLTYRFSTNESTNPSIVVEGDNLSETTAIKIANLVTSLVPENYITDEIPIMVAINETKYDIRSLATVPKSDEELSYFFSNEHIESCRNIVSCMNTILNLEFGASILVYNGRDLEH